jgi:hypothetical protein
VPIVSYVRGAPEYRGTAGSDAERCFAPRSFLPSPMKNEDARMYRGDLALSA